MSSYALYLSELKRRKQHLGRIEYYIEFLSIRTYNRHTPYWIIFLYFIIIYLYLIDSKW